MVRAARITMTICQSATAGMRASPKSLRTSANAAALEPTARYAVMGMGAPSYASGAHMWNGTAATLKPRPATIITRPTTTPGLMPEVAASTSLIPSKRVVPSSP